VAEKDRNWVARIAGKVGAEINEVGKSIVQGGIDEVWNGAGPQGAHELAAALFNGNAFVMYPRHGNAAREDQGVHGQQQDIPNQAQAAQDHQQQQERGGREL
jgi:hypothetical protein